MRRYDIMIDDVRKKVEGALTNKSGSLLTEDEKEYSIRILIAPTEIAELGDIAIGKNMMNGRPIRLGDVASLVEGAGIIRGSGAIDGKPGVILRIIRQPEAQTITVTDEINKAFTSLKASLPSGVVLHPNLFRQENFIRAGLKNVEDALRDGTILVVIILIIFLMNVRTIAILRLFRSPFLLQLSSLRRSDCL